MTTPCTMLAGSLTLHALCMWCHWRMQNEIFEQLRKMKIIVETALLCTVYAVSLTPHAHIISRRIRSRIQKCLSLCIRTPEGNVWWKNLRSKISWHCLFKTKYQASPGTRTVSSGSGSLIFLALYFQIKILASLHSGLVFFKGTVSRDFAVLNIDSNSRINLIFLDNGKLKILFYCHEAGKITSGWFFDRRLL
jgi:hypothetical protein